jgi:hypothetical protein
MNAKFRRPIGHAVPPRLPSVRADELYEISARNRQRREAADAELEAWHARRSARLRAMRERTAADRK